MSQKSETNQQLGAELNFLVDNTPDAIIRVNKEFDIRNLTSLIII